MQIPAEYVSYIGRATRVTCEPELIQCLAHGVTGGPIETHMSGAWFELVADDRILSALILLNTKVPETHRALERVVAKAVRILVRKCGKHTLASYSSEMRQIWVAPKTVAMPLTVLASILAHEMRHAVFKYRVSMTDTPTVEETQEGPAQLLESELAAHALEAIAWKRLRTGAEPEAARSLMDRTLAAYEEGKLVPHVLAMRGYQKTIFGRPVKVKMVREATKGH